MNWLRMSSDRKRSTPQVVLIVWLSYSHCLSADDRAEPLAETTSEKQALLKQVEQLEESSRETRSQREATQAEMTELRKQATDFQQALQALSRQLEQIQAEQTRLAEAIPKQEAAAIEANAKQQAAEEAAKKAREEADKAAKEAAEATKKPDESRQRLAELKEMLPSVVEALPKAQQDYAPFLERLDYLQSTLDGLDHELAENDLHIESLLREAGEWISFSAQIAPIFYEKCLACHNKRSAKGQFNMSTFTTIMTSGESGGAVVPGDDEFSTLCVLVEDGSMPQDAEPLDSEQIQLIKHWVKMGARLDSKSDPFDPLIRIMPPVEQPPPPESYRVPIPVTALAVRSHGDFLASSGYHEVLIWSLADHHLKRRITNVAERVHGLGFHADGNRLAVASGTPGRLGEVKLFNVDTGELLADLFVSEDEMFDVAFSSDGEHLAAAGAEGVIAIFQVTDSSSKPVLLTDHSDWVNSVSWSADGQLLVSASRDKTAKVFNAETGQLQFTFSGHSQNVIRAMFLPDGKQVASAAADGDVRIWNVKDGKESKRIDHLSGDPVSLDMPNLQHLLISTDRELNLYSITDDKLVPQFTSPHPVTSLTIDDKGRYLIGTLTGRILVVSPGQQSTESSWLAKPE